MPLSHRCCISSSSVFIAPLFAEVIKVDCNFKHALTVLCLPAHGVGRIFFITVMVFGHYHRMLPFLGTEHTIILSPRKRPQPRLLDQDMRNGFATRVDTPILPDLGIF